MSWWSWWHPQVSLIHLPGPIQVKQCCSIQPIFRLPALQLCPLGLSNQCLKHSGMGNGLALDRVTPAEGNGQRALQTEMELRAGGAGASILLLWLPAAAAQCQTLWMFVQGLFLITFPVGFCNAPFTLSL